MLDFTSPKKENRGEHILVRLLTLLLTAALLLGALVLVVYRDRLNLDALKRWLTYRSLETTETGQAAPFTHAGDDRLSMAFLDTGILFSSAAGAHYYAIGGQSYAEQVVELENPVLSAGRRSGVVYDAGGQALFLFRDGQQSTTLTLEGNGDLLSARANDAGWLAVTAQQSGYKGAVTVYDPQGAKVIQVSLSSTFVVDAAISPDCRRVAVVTIGQEGGAFRTQVSFYPIDRPQPTAQINLGNVVVLDMEFEKDRLWLVCDDRVLTIDSKGEDVVSYAYGHQYLKGYDLGGDDFALLLLSSYAAGSADTALTLDQDCDPLMRMSLSGQQVLDYSCAGTYAAILTGRELTICDRMLSVYARLEDPQNARHLALRSDGAAALADRQQCWLYIPD